MREIVTTPLPFGFIAMMPGRCVEAEPLARACLATRTAKKAAPGSVGRAKALFGQALAGLDRWEEAEPLLTEACGEVLASDAFNVDALRQALPCLIGRLERTNRAEAAAPWRVKLLQLTVDSARK